MRFFKSNVGLYIGPKTIQLAQLQLVSGKITITNFVHADIYEDEQKLATAEREDLILSTLRKVINKAKISTNNINTILMPGMVLLRYFQMPRIPPEEMEEAVKFEAKKYIPFKLEEAVTGFYILKEEEATKKMGILSLVTKEEYIKNHLATLRKVNISPVAIETASFAIIRLLEYTQLLDYQASNAIIYLYAQRLNIIILKNGVPYFVRDISLERKEEWIDDETAEMLMAKGEGPLDTRVIKLENVLSELKISFEYYKKELGRENISKIILCGETDIFDDLSAVEEVAKEISDNESALGVYLQKKLNIPVHLIDPLKNIQCPKAKPLPYTFPMLAITVGAALKGLVKSPAEIDLFKARQAPRLKRQAIYNKIIMLEATTLVLISIILFVVFSIFVSQENNLLEREKRNAPKFIDLSPFTDAKLTQGEKEIKSRITTYKKVVEDRVVLTDKLNIIPKYIPDGVWLSNVSFRVTSSEKGQVEMMIAGNVFTLKQGLEVDMVNKFSEGLKGDEQFFAGFKTTKTGSVSRNKFRGEQVMGFEIQCSSAIETQ